MLSDLTGLEIEFDGVVNLNFGVGVPDGPSIMSDDVGDLVGSNFLGSNSEEFVLTNKDYGSYLGFLGLDGEQYKSSSHIPQQSVMLSSFLE